MYCLDKCSHLILTMLIEVMLTMLIEAFENANYTLEGSTPDKQVAQSDG